MCSLFRQEEFYYMNENKQNIVGIVGFCENAARKSRKKITYRGQQWNSTQKPQDTNEP